MQIGSAGSSPRWASSSFNDGRSQQQNRSGPYPELVDELTTSDRELIYRATGQTLDSSTTLPPLARHVAIDRRTGVLRADQPVSISYLKGLEAANSQFLPVWGDSLDRAIRYLSENAGARLDVLA